MKIGDLPGASYYAYLAGSSHAHSRAYIMRARAEIYPETKKLFVNWARSENHAALRYLKLAKEPQ